MIHRTRIEPDSRPIMRFTIPICFVEHEVVRRVLVTDLEAESDIRVNKLELQFVNIRHIQQHTGELYERLGAQMDIRLNWTERRHRLRRSAKRAA